MGWCLTLAAVCAAGCGSRLPVDLAPNMERARLIRHDIDSGAAAALASGPTLVEPTGWATLTGTFKLLGAPPVEDPLRVTSDFATCAPGGMAPAEGTIKVGPDGGLANVLVFLTTEAPAEVPGWEHPDYEADREALRTAPFDQKTCIFLSRIYALRATQSVTVKNSDNVGHNANIQPRSGARPANFTIPGGQSAVYEPKGATNDPFPVTCSIHPWMKAWMISRNNPYFAVTDETGAFKIENLPAAAGLKLEFRGWHERGGYLQKVTVDGQAVQWKRGRFEVELTPGDAKHLEITIDASVLQ
jgi:hypothetical protein